MYNIVRTEDYNTYKIRHFIVDYTSDLYSIVSSFANELHGGWSATVVSSGATKTYTLKNDLSSWVEGTTPTIML